MTVSRSAAGVLVCLALVFVVRPGPAAQKDASPSPPPPSSPVVNTQPQCEARLKHLAESLRTYAAENDGALPNRLSHLYYGGYVQAIEDLACPGATNGPAERSEIDAKTSYVLLAARWPTDGRVPILGERTAAHAGHMGVVFSDAAVEWLATLPALPQPTTTSVPASALPVVRNPGPYTGLIVDCRGFHVARDAWPKIKDSAANELWGKVEESEIDDAIARGLVSYHPTVEAAQQSERAGNNPLVIKAVGSDGGSKTFAPDAVISPEDAQLLQAENPKTHFLEKLNVCFVID